jgi:hypothetical protein
MNRSYSAPYSKERDRISSKSDNDAIHDIKKYLSKKYNVRYDHIKVVNHSNTKTDFEGTDFTFKIKLENGVEEILVQKKALKYCGYDTVTTTRKEIQKYKKGPIRNGYLFHCYYLPNNPGHIIQYCMIPMREYLQHQKEYNTNHSTGTEFAYIEYHDIDIASLQNVSLKWYIDELLDEHPEIDDFLNNV